MARTENEIELTAWLDRLGALYTRLSFAHDSRRQDELLEHLRVAIAGVRRSRARLAATETGAMSGRAGRHQPGACAAMRG